MDNNKIEGFLPLLEKCKEHIEQSRNELDVKEKIGSDFVTNIDFEIEAMIIDFLKTTFPEDRIISEETAVKQALLHSKFIFREQILLPYAGLIILNF